YSISVQNNGPDTATTVVLTDTLPAGATFVSAEPSSACNQAGGTVACSLGTIPSGLSALAVIVVKATTSNPLTNVASAVGGQTDPVPANNTSSETTVVNAFAPWAAGGVIPGHRCDP